MSRATLLLILSVSVLVVFGCNDSVISPKPEPDKGGIQSGSVELQGIGTTPGFSDWISEPTILNGPIEEIFPEDDVERCLNCPPTLRQENRVIGGIYGFDTDGDKESDETLTAEKGVIIEVRPTRESGYVYEWTFTNLGTGAVTQVDCGPNAPTFSISESDPLVGTAGADRLSGTGDDLEEGQRLVQTQTSTLAPQTVLCAVSFNPTTARALELLVPLPEAPTRKEQCKNGGWRDFGFKNQGQCIRYVVTGKDSRPASGD